MVQTSFALMTNVGRAKEAAALANGTTVNITQIAIGDGATVPSGGETALYNEVARKAVSGHGTVTGASNVAYFDIYLAAADGPYTIREAGLYDDTGALIAIAHYDPPINKPVPSSGTTVEGVIRLEVAFSNVANITIVVDPSFQVALQRLSRLPWIPVISMSITAPPAAVAGDCYLIPTGATGSWAGNVGKIAEYTTAGWAMITAANGHGISLPDGRVFERVSGAYVEKIALDSQSGKWNYAVAGGTANALAATLTPAPLALTAGLELRIKITSLNTGPVTLDLNGLGAKAVVLLGSRALSGREFPVGSVVSFTYDGTNWIAGDGVSAASYSGSQYFGTPGAMSFTVPQGVTKITAEIWGGGGASGSALTAGSGSAGGGAGCGYSRKVIDVTPGQVLTGTVGAGAGVSGGSGGTTSFGGILTATGGGGGANAPSGNGGSAGIGSGGDFNAGGGGGTAGGAGNASGGPGGMGAFGGAGGQGGYGLGGGGQTPGGGGGGPGAAASNFGALGAAGAINIRW